MLGAVLVLLAPLSGCERRPGASEATPQSMAEVVASVGGTKISRQAFEREWRRHAGTRSKEEVLQDMVRFEATLAKARAAGVDRDPELVAAFDRLVVSKFEAAELQRRGADAIQVSDAEIRGYYDTSGERFSNPAKLRLGVIVRQASAKATPERRSALRQEAEALWREAKQAEEKAFHALAVQHSEDQATRYAGGDTGWFVPTPGDSRWEPAVLEAAAALGAPGDLAPLVETGRGFYIVKLLGKQASSRRPLAEVREGIAYHLRQQKAQALREKFSEEMQAGLAIQINRAALAAVTDHPTPDLAGPPPLPGP